MSVLRYLYIEVGMKIKNQYEKLIALVLTVSIFVTSFSSMVQISAQTDGALPSQAAKVTISKDDIMQTASKPIEPTVEYEIIT